MSAETSTERAIARWTACGSSGSVGRGQPLDDVLEEAAARTATSSRCRPPRGRCRPAPGCARRARRPAGPAGPEWQQPRLSSRGAATQLPSAPATRGGLGVGEHEVVADDVVRLGTHGRRPAASASPGSVPRSRSHTGTRCRLRVEGQPLLHAAVQVDRQRRQPQRGAGEPDQRAVGGRRAAPPVRRRSARGPARCARARRRTARRRPAGTRPGGRRSAGAP